MISDGVLLLLDSRF